MLSFISMCEDFYDAIPDPSGNGDTQYSVLNMDKPMVKLGWKTSDQSVAPQTDNSLWSKFTSAKSTVADQTKVPNDQLYKDNFGNELVKTSSGRVMPLDKYVAMKQIDSNDVGLQNARGNLEGQTSGITNKLGYGINRISNWVGHNPVPSAALLAGGAYIAAQNRDKIRNTVQNFLPGRSAPPVGY